MNKHTDNFLLYNYDVLPPDDVVSIVNPFSKTLRIILAGLVLWIIKLNFLNLNYLLPLAGIMLMFTGFRTLKKENCWFFACFVITVIQLAELSAALILNTTIFHNEIYQSPFMTALTCVSTLLSFLLFFCFGKGIKAVQKKSNLPESAGGTVALIIWYAVLSALALLSYSGIIIGVIMLIAFICILVSLSGISKELDEAGYILSPPVFKIPNRAICSLICLAIIAGGICGYTFGGKYSMQWQPQTADSSQYQHLKAYLSSLGFPEEILNDLSEKDLAECEGALKVEVKEELHPANEGRKVTNVNTDPSGHKTYIHTTVYDQKELLITSVAVKLPTERETWKIFHHFSWQITPSFYGTECIRIIPAYNFNASHGWRNTGEISGRILYDTNNTTYTAPYERLGEYTHTSNDIIFGENTSSDIYATFSMPHHGTNHRGYVCYTTEETQHGWILSSWIDYTHQKDFFQYPNQTAMDNNLKSFINRSDTFISVQDAIQFSPTTEQ